MMPVVALWISILFGGLAQIALKLAVRPTRTDFGPRAMMWWAHLLRSPWLWSYIGCFSAATSLWLVALSKLNISYAFPLLSAGYVLVAVLARVFLKEPVSGRRWSGIAVICAGIIVIALT